jgi:hypothetical protein
MQPTPEKNRPRNLLKYTSLASQLAVGIGLGTYAGLKLDEWLQWKVPVFVWLLPLAVMSLALYKLVKEFSKNG